MNRCESIYFSVLFCRVPCGTGLFRVAALRLHSFAALRNRKRPLQSLSELNKKRGRRKNSWNFTNFAYDLFAVSTYTKCFKIFFQEEIWYIKQYEKLIINQNITVFYSTIFEMILHKVWKVCLQTVTWHETKSCQQENLFDLWRSWCKNYGIHWKKP